MVGSKKEKIDKERLKEELKEIEREQELIDFKISSLKDMLLKYVLEEKNEKNTRNKRVTK